MDPPILITGAARSGTSLVAGIIHLCGAWGGKFVAPSISNPKGFFENRAMREEIVKPYLRLCGFDPRAQMPLPRPEFLVPWKDLRGQVETILQGQGYPGGPWFYKDPKIIHLWPKWREAFPEAKWVLVRRGDEEIISSCLRTTFMRAYSEAEGWATWLNIHKERMGEMLVELVPNIMEVWPRMAISGNFGQMQAMIEWLGLKWNEAAIREFVSPELWGGRE